MEKKTFQKGQRVSTFDEDDNMRVFGVVVEVFAQKIVVKWDDMPDNIEHFEGEYKDIRIEKQPPQMRLDEFISKALDANEKLVQQQSVEIKTLAREVLERGEILRDILSALDSDPNDGITAVLPEALVERIRKAVEK